MLNDIVEVYSYISAFTANNTLRVVTPFTATAAQTTFTVAYTPGFVDVFYNGSKLAASEYTASNGVSITLGTAAQLNDIVEVTAYSYTVGAFTGIGGSGTANYVAKFTSGSTIGTSSIYDSGSNVGINTINPIYTLDVSGSARFTNTATITGSLNVSGSNTLIGTKTITGSVFISGSKTIIGTNTITGSLNVSGSITSTGTLTAQTLVVQTITSSVLYSSGSNVFGNALSNTQVMTGSVGITGSLNVAGATTISSAATYALDVTGTGRFSLASTGSGAVLNVGNVGSGVFGGLAITDGGTYPMKIWGSELQFLTGNSVFSSATTRLTISSTGAATFSGSVKMGGGVASGTMLTVANGTNSREFQFGYSTGAGYNYLQVYDGANFQALNINNTMHFTGSSVGIGTTNPTQPLHVYTTATTTSTYFETNAANSYIGLKSTSGICYIGNVSYNMTFEAGGSERMRISGSGNVGIGTTTPYGKLNIKGASTIPTTQTYNGLFVMESSDNRTSLQMGIYNAAISGIDGAWIQSYNQPATAAGNYALMINPLGGNVGINTTTPDSKLHIISNASTGTDNYALRLQNTTTVADARVGIAFLDNAQTGSNGSGATIQVSNNGVDGTGNLLFGSLLNGTNTERMRITSGGIATVNSYAAITGGTFDVPASTTKTVTVAFNAGNIHAFLGFSSQSGGITGAGSKSIFLGGTTNDGSGHTPTVISTFSYGDQVVGAATTNTSAGFTFTITNNKAAIVSWTWSAFGSYGSITVT
jgi:hypothetical protein